MSRHEEKFSSSNIALILALDAAAKELIGPSWRVVEVTLPLGKGVAKPSPHSIAFIPNKSQKSAEDLRFLQASGWSIWHLRGEVLLAKSDMGGVSALHFDIDLADTFNMNRHWEPMRAEIDGRVKRY